MTVVVVRYGWLSKLGSDPVGPDIPPTGSCLSRQGISCWRSALAADWWEAALLQQLVELRNVAVNYVTRRRQLCSELPVQYLEYFLGLDGQ